ncbi:MAG: FTR1 family protein [Burkholderiales bacterium]|nr:FTR1 family protein [Burkholderiales bacterium]
MLNALVVVWRESLEALLVIGVLLAWTARQRDPAPLRRGLWWGVALGVLLAALLGGATLLAQSQLQGQALDVFRLLVMFGAAALIVQMVLWMRRHGATLRRELESRAANAAGARGIALVAALAVAREGAETVVFLYGIGLEAGAGALVAAAAGLALAVASAALIARGARLLSYRLLFRASEVVLLLVAAALLAAGVDQLIAMDWLAPLLDPVWDSSALLDDSAGLGRLLADFIGYRARPSATLLMAYAAYWALAAALLAATRCPRPAAR